MALAQIPFDYVFMKDIITQFTFHVLLSHKQELNVFPLIADIIHYINYVIIKNPLFAFWNPISL